MPVLCQLNALFDLASGEGGMLISSTNKFYYAMQENGFKGNGRDKTIKYTQTICLCGNAKHMH